MKLKLKSGDKVKWVEGNGTYLKDQKVYTIRAVDSSGEIWLEKCDYRFCQSMVVGRVCMCKSWCFEDGFTLFEESPILENPTLDQIKQASNMPSPDDVALFFRKKS